MEWDRLPHRFLLEYYALNEKDFFKSLDYAYRDTVMFNITSRGLFHNLDHYSFGPLASTPPSPTFTDQDPAAQYSTENMLNTYFLRFKTPDFPLHVYAEFRTVDKQGTVQQRFLQGYFRTTGGVEDIHKVSQSRDIDWKTDEVKAGVNSHLGPVEVDYHHRERRFEAGAEKILSADYPLACEGAGCSLVRLAGTYPHNLVPDLESSSDTVKLHTAHTGKIVAAATYTTGKSENHDGHVRTEYWNAAGDLTITPRTDTSLFFKYRHYDVSAQNPDTVLMPGSPQSYTYAVRDAVSSQRDVMTGTVRYRPSDRMTLKGEYIFETVQRDVGVENTTMQLELSPNPGRTTPAFWDIAPRTQKNTVKLGATYRIMKKLTLRADVSHLDVDHPAHNADPDVADRAKVTATWSPGSKVMTVLGYTGVREKRTEMEWEGTSGPVTGGKREASRHQVLGSVTVFLGKRSSLTTSYAFFRNRMDQTIAYHDGSGAVVLDPGLVPYDDVAHAGSVALGHSISETIQLTAEASRSYSRGSFQNTGSVPNTDGIASFSDLRVIEDLFAAGLEIELGRNIGTELRYQYRQYNDRVDSSQDGTAQFALATMSLKW
jgi:hypothetical protein